MLKYSQLERPYTIFRHNYPVLQHGFLLSFITTIPLFHMSIYFYIEESSHLVSDSYSIKNSPRNAYKYKTEQVQENYMQHASKYTSTMYIPQRNAARSHPKKCSACLSCLCWKLMHQQSWHHHHWATSTLH